MLSEPGVVQPGAVRREPTRILALATNPETGASTRFRVLQWASELRQAGFALSLEAFFSEPGAVTIYQPGRWLSKAAHLVSGTCRRFISLAGVAQRAEILFIHREIFPLGRRVFLNAIERFPGPVIYDYDDAMFLPQRFGRGWLARLEDLETPRRVMALSDVVLAGNTFLADYARQYARHVVYLPTCIDTGRFSPQPKVRAAGQPLVVGWIGSHSTAKYLQGLRPVLERVARDIPFHLYVVGSPYALSFNGVEIEQVQWSLHREVDDFGRCDVGLYPLWDDGWAQGKCGFKAIEFMACGVPVIATAVGANRDIIQDGVNGYLASTEPEWVEKLKRLLLDADLRQRFGYAGRSTVEERYSLTAHALTLITALRETLGRAQAAASPPEIPRARRAGERQMKPAGVL